MYIDDLRSAYIYASRVGGSRKSHDELGIEFDEWFKPYQDLEDQSVSIGYWAAKELGFHVDALDRYTMLELAKAVVEHHLGEVPLDAIYEYDLPEAYLKQHQNFEAGDPYFWYTTRGKLIAREGADIEDLHEQKEAHLQRAEEITAVIRAIETHNYDRVPLEKKTKTRTENVLVIANWSKK